MARTSATSALIWSGFQSPTPSYSQCVTTDTRWRGESESSSFVEPRAGSESARATARKKVRARITAWRA